MPTSIRTMLPTGALLLAAATTSILFAQQPNPMTTNPFLALMTTANAHAKAHRAPTPTLSPLDATLLGEDPPVNVAQLHQAGFKIIPWTTNDPAKMRALIALRVDGIISDYPNLLQQVVKEEAAAHPEEAAYFKTFDVSAHRGGRGLRPENTLPSFESGLDHLSTTLETDTGVTSDHVSLIWHDQFLNPESCRRADGKPYTREERIYTRDITLAEAQSTFICDKLHHGPDYANARFDDQQNDLALSPVAVAFAKHEHLISPYVPTHAEQLFRFTRFYADYYSKGPGKSHPDAAARAANALTVRFNLETKITPLPEDPAGPPPPLPEHHEPTTNHTFDPQTFVTTLCGAIARNHMESRAEVQSFDFRTLNLVEEQFPRIPTFYLTYRPGPDNTIGFPVQPSTAHKP